MNPNDDPKPHAFIIIIQFASIWNILKSFWSILKYHIWFIQDFKSG
jgi:hypothetical protein